MQILYRYFRYSSSLFLFFCCSLLCHQSFMRNQEGKIDLQKKYIKDFLWGGMTLFWLHTFLSMFFCCFLRLLPPASLVAHLRNGSYKDIYCYGWYSVWYHEWTIENMKISYNLILHAFFISSAFLTQPPCCLAFSWIELQILFRCSLIRMTIIIHFIFYI